MPEHTTHFDDCGCKSAKLASAIEVLRLLANPEFWDCLEPECGGVGSCQNDSHSKVVWITHAEGNGYDDARKWLEENVEATQNVGGVRFPMLNE